MRFNYFQVQLFFAFAIIITIISCSQDFNTIEDKGYSGVDSRLWSYFQRFETEGMNRGIAVDLNTFGISGEIVDIPGNGVAGQCQFGSHITNHVSIDQNYWNRANDINREFVVFHELGHCFLLRDHTEGQFNNGVCASIMRSGLGPCNDAYTIENRSYYLDELFNRP